MKKHLLHIFFFCCFISVVIAENNTAEFKASLSSEKIVIGEQTTITLKLTCKTGDKIEWFSMHDTLSKHIEIIQIQAQDTSYDSSNFEIQYLIQNITITSFDSGLHVIKPFTIKLNDQRIESNPLLLMVNTVLVDMNKDIHDIKPPLHVSMTLLDWLIANWKILALVWLILTVLTIFLYWYFIFRKKKNRLPIVKKEISISPFELAIQKLKTLEDKKYWQEGKFKQYHSEISEIIREYIENIYNIPALEQTTTETLYQLRHEELTDEIKQKLKKILILSDMVKFAKEVPSDIENERVMVYAYEFIDFTKPTQILNDIKT